MVISPTKGRIKAMVSDKNVRFLVTLPKELKEELIALAKEDNRSLNNLIATILSKYVKSRTTQD